MINHVTHCPAPAPWTVSCMLLKKYQQGTRTPKPRTGDVRHSSELGSLTQWHACSNFEGELAYQVRWLKSSGFRHVVSLCGVRILVGTPKVLSFFRSFPTVPQSEWRYNTSIRTQPLPSKSSRVPHTPIT